MKKIGITGGVGSGKTIILNYLKEKYNAEIVVADEVAHLLEAKGMDCYNELVNTFGKSILDDDENIDKKKFASVLFSNEENVNIVNSIVHPRVNQYIFDKMDEAQNNDISLFIVEAALLLENGYDRILDELWYIFVDKNIRRERLKINRGYSDEKIDSIFKSQMSDEEYKKHCVFVIDNNNTVEETYSQIDKYLSTLMISKS